MEPADLTLLVVDDNEENRDVLARRLERRGYGVVTAENGQRALDVIAAQPVDLVLLDIMMPVMDGLQALKAIRERPETADLPVIMASARSESDDIVEALELGADDYVTKPLDFPVVLARVQRQLRARRAPAPSPAPASGGVAAPGTLGPGVVLADRYRIEKKLGAGNFGAVYRARHLDLDRAVALKVLQAVHVGGGDAVTRFRREGVAACRVKHDNAVAILDFGLTAEGVAYLVMELLEGRSLEDELFGQGVLDPQRCAEILAPVCAALGEAHRSGIVHRDVKPANVFLHRGPLGEVPKVLDFGIAKIVGEAALSEKLTVEGYVLGTPVYMAPERFRNRPYDGRSDVYSLGVMLFQMLVGRLPFLPPADDPMAVVTMHMTQPPPSLRGFEPTLPETVDALVQRCLAKQPEERPDVETLAREFAEAARQPGGGPGEARLGLGPAVARPWALPDARTEPRREDEEE